MVGCADYKKYHKWEDFNRTGYRETKVANDLYSLIYQGAGNNQPDEVYQYFLKRAAELSKQNGFQYFRVENGQPGSRLNAVVTWPNYTGQIRFLKEKKKETDFSVGDFLQ